MRFGQGAEYAAAVARAVAEENTRAAPVFISGATGPKAEFINGYFLPTEEKGLDGRLVYRKQLDQSRCVMRFRFSVVLKHQAGKWQIQYISDEGGKLCVAWIQGGCSMEFCTSCLWKVYNGKTWNDQPRVKILTRSAANVQNNCFRLRAHDGDAQPLSYRTLAV